MSHALISRNADLQNLLDDGFEIEIVGSYLVVHSIPYVNATSEIKFGRLISDLDLAGDRTVQPKCHTVRFSGEYPCSHDGKPLEKIRNSSQNERLHDGLTSNHRFSSKPKVGHYKDYFEKMSTYAAIISNEAAHLDPNISPRTFRVLASKSPDTPFAYPNTAIARAGIGVISQKLESGKVAIVGLGGTGSYILDQLAKTPVKQVDLFDGDDFGTHNAYRAPGAPDIASLNARISKVEYFRSVYSRMHRNIIAHNHRIDEENVELLREMDFVFLCLDSGKARKLIVEYLESCGISFIDVGMGVQLVDDRLIGSIRVTTSTAEMREHVQEANRIPYQTAEDNNQYVTNIQISELNALNAQLAIIKWKKLLGFYADLKREHHTVFNTDGNHIINEDMPA